MKRLSLFLTALATLTLLTFQGCKDDDENENNADPSTETKNESNGTENQNSDNSDETIPALSTGEFVFGADPGWLTAMEKQGIKFKDANGTETECLMLLRKTGFDAIRLRVWVNPSASENGIWGFCDREDVLAKAKRAKALNYRIMVDFHYSDTWADPGKQKKPAAWNDISTIEDLGKAVYEHTYDVLTYLKDNDINVEWVQVGNETHTGMLKTQSDGSSTSINGELSYNNENFTTLFNQGAAAAKNVYPSCKVIFHIDKGNEFSGLNWALVRLKATNANYDIIGVSLYPVTTESNWYANYISSCINNLNKVAEAYNKDVMICELGVESINSWNGKRAIVNTVLRAQKEVSRCKGVFYWEPECFNSFNGYTMGGFLSNGSPSEALGVFGGKFTEELPETDTNAEEVDENSLIVSDMDGTKIAVATLQDDGTYTCTVTVTTTWYKFQVADASGTKYGCNASGSTWVQYSFVKGSANDNFWFGDETGTFNVVFDPANEKWSYTKQ